MQHLLTAERKVIEPAVQTSMQTRCSIPIARASRILQVQLLSVDPPPTVIAAFRDVTARRRACVEQRFPRFAVKRQATALPSKSPPIGVSPSAVAVRCFGTSHSAGRIKA